jgi:hypothetical protein
MQQRIDHGPRCVTGSGMYGHACRLVDDDYMVVFVEDFEGKIFGLSFERRARQDFHVYDLAAREAVRAFGLATIYAHAPVGD